ncbi:uncharacterized protein LOC113547592 [Pangasianodon hypophthalmus]|uniref:uncharacterized protein LOC113547592 n=1 Tax=Pangasianodon hypophthalmus TaxID=310915 RepID=UPI00230833DE|nr:uncharacterized protein LOC113547592 [Pangasianodon hypophthalmus]
MVRRSPRLAARRCSPPDDVRISSGQRMVRRKRTGKQEVDGACSSPVTTFSNISNSRNRESLIPNTTRALRKLCFWLTTVWDCLKLVIASTLLEFLCTFLLNSVVRWSRKRNQKGGGACNTVSNTGIGPTQNSAWTLVMHYTGHLILWHGLKFGITSLVDGRLTAYVKKCVVLFLLLFGVCCVYRHTQMENEMKFLKQTVENQKLEYKMLQKDMQELLIRMRSVESDMYKLHMASEHLRIKVDTKKSEIIKEAEHIVHMAMSLHRADGIGMAEFALESSETCINPTHHSLFGFPLQHPNSPNTIIQAMDSEEEEEEELRTFT